MTRQYGWILHFCAVFSLACGSRKYGRTPVQYPAILPSITRNCTRKRDIKFLSGLPDKFFLPRMATLRQRPKRSSSSSFSGRCRALQNLSTADFLPLKPSRQAVFYVREIVGSRKVRLCEVAWGLCRFLLRYNVCVCVRVIIALNEPHLNVEVKTLVR